ncbi:hypothetical protein HBI40_023160 [Parastagonospora nodorum]|nr:hypothetical protein HBI75_050790 [Parastagonospora nodorum]KAH5323414.1 hypothetical protein HBI11_042950 [Parastagonospora nodorum]KAH5485572.1 hypothetical protein HBI31_155580 [Parastagonospora nodorum]KAH5682604.1 hypothetical protein HBI21_038910 [Parastagonospora nodorum]KAH6263546.1 hypothetical protein HBI41_120330 [Parastagonospora nodorum]
MISKALKLITLATVSTAFECTRSHLENVATQYVGMMATGQHDLFENLAYTMQYVENNKTSTIINGTPAFGMTIDSNRSMLDTTQCKTFTEIIVTDPKHPYVIHTQMTLDDEGNVVLIDSLVTDKGDWAFNATGYKYWNSQENWDPIPENMCLPRETIKAAGDAYANRCNDVSVHVPFGTPCARLEGGAYTGRGNLSANTCDIGGLPEHIPMVNRRYVVDEVYGVVDVFMGFTGLDRTRNDTATPDSHLFRVEDGKIRYIHTASACFVDGCGMNGTGPPPGAIRRRGLSFNV